jgi:hypothetical protein
LAACDPAYGKELYLLYYTFSVMMPVFDPASVKGRYPLNCRFSVMMAVTASTNFGLALSAPTMDWSV